jgi:hypothetical protein
MITVGVTDQGPVFDGQWHETIRDYQEDVTWAVGQQAYADVHSILDASIQQPTPYYETQITQQRGGVDDITSVESDVVPVAVHDRGVIYGHWLEGTGSRNAPVTSFRGYGAFGKTAAALNLANGRTIQLAEGVLQRYLPRLRGVG